MHLTGMHIKAHPVVGQHTRKAFNDVAHLNALNLFLGGDLNVHNL
jgi:hypothetical protein